LEAGVLSGRGVRLANRDRDSVPWLAAHAGLAFQLPLYASLSLRLWGDAVVPFGRSRFQFQRDDSELEAVHRPAGLGARLGAEAHATF
jgi:hypothetical protein